jgi:hypothetical protein
MKSLSNFIFIHDQEIILDFLEKNRFKELENFKWVFLGNNPVDKISHLNNLIVARELENNIEDYPKLTSFTGWYALYKNGFLNSDYVNLFEYDIHYIPEFIDINKQMITKDFDFIGYFPMSVKDVVYLTQTQYTKELVDSIENKFGYNIVKYIHEMEKSNPQMLWSSSSNSTWKTEILKKYIDWFYNFIEDIHQSQYCGHMHERSLSFYYFKEKLKVYLTRNLMIHVQLNSHGTSPLPPERAKMLYSYLK